MGWKDAPKHVCKKKTKAGLVFCCPNKKKCPARNDCLRQYGISDDLYHRIKESFEADFDDRHPKIDVCFGSLIWCCKDTRICLRRDRALRKLGMTFKEYMALKKKMSLEFEKINDN
ncbi:MAG: methanogenesis marker 9 domain-containing protein [Candidatus Aenigmarchaeota archaeon]|nr:methanogenesis marker 9 domain-containing protein [Candidatus Aenigmarchaeota archaeon]